MSGRLSPSAVEPFAEVRDQGPDVSATLAELERKLHELERELRVAAPVVAPPPPPVAAKRPVVPPVPAPAAGDDDAGRLVADARRRLGALGDEIDDLLRFRADLERLARQLEGEQDRMMTRLGTPAPAPAPAASPEPVAPPEPVATPIPGEHGAPPLAAAFAGTVVVDAGPFADVATLGAFEQALGTVDGVDDVCVTAFEDRRAIVEVRLTRPVALAAELPPVLPPRAAVVPAGPDRIAVHLQPAEG